MALAVTTLPLLRDGPAPRLVLVCVSPPTFQDKKQFVRIEEGILSSPICRREQGEWLASEHLHLARLRRSVPYYRSWWTGEGLDAEPPLRGFMPQDGRPTEQSLRQNTPEDLAGQSVELAPARLGVIEEMARIAARRGFRLAVVLPPVIDRRALYELSVRQYAVHLRAAQKQLGFEVLDYTRADVVPLEGFLDLFHLNRQGARVFTARLADDVARLLPSAPAPAPATSPAPTATAPIAPS